MIIENIKNNLETNQNLNEIDIKITNNRTGAQLKITSAKRESSGEIWYVEKSPNSS